MPTPYEDGPRDSSFVVCAEAPAITEIVQSKPLVGKVGQFTSRLLSEADIVRAELRLMNVCRDRIDSTDEFMTVSQNGGIATLTDKGRALQQDLAQRLQGTKPNTILALGRLAALCLTDDKRPITKIRGSPMACSLLEGAEVIPTIHPGAAMGYRNPRQRFYIVADMRKALIHSQQPGLQVEDWELLIEPSYTTCLDFLNDCRKHNRVSFDIEVYNHQVSCVSFCFNTDVAISIPFARGYGEHYWEPSREATIWRAIAELLSDPNVEKNNQYIGFDISFLMSQNRIRTLGKLHDTYIAQKVMYPGFPASLQFLTSIHTDQPYYKDDKKIWRRLDRDIKRFWKYSCRDALCAHKIMDEQELDIYGDEGFTTTYENTLHRMDSCLYMMTRGIPMNGEKLRETSKEIRKELEDVKSEFDESCEIPVNPESSKQVINYFYAIKGLSPYLNRKTKRPTCDDKALRRIVRRDGLKEARLLQRYRSLSKLLNTYLEMGFDADERLRCFYDIRGTVTGRLSSGQTVRETGGNMQNLHPAFKSFIIPDKEEDQLHWNVS